MCCCKVEGTVRVEFAPLCFLQRPLSTSCVRFLLRCVPAAIQSSLAPGAPCCSSCQLPLSLAVLRPLPTVSTPEFSRNQVRPLPHYHICHINTASRIASNHDRLHRALQSSHPTLSHPQLAPASGFHCFSVSSIESLRSPYTPSSASLSLSTQLSLPSLSIVIAVSCRPPF